MRRLPIAVLILLAGLCLAATARAAQMPLGSSDQPVHVVADKLEVDNKTQVAHFIGKVKAVQGDVTITCDTLSVYYDQSAQDKGKGAKAKAAKAKGLGEGLMDGGGQVRMVVAQGHVKVVQKDRVAVGRKATYWAGGRKMLLEGKATVWRGKNQVSGEQITVFLDQDRAVVHGKPGKRVSVTIVPQQLKKDQ
ncbi:MAG: lipopolysaccharide transport periplasmic protein LptA [Thermodesulfobacteriota bacterium]